LVLKWDVRNEDKGKYEKFENHWKGSFKIAYFHGSNAYLFQNLIGEFLAGGPTNGKFLKSYFS